MSFDLIVSFRMYASTNPFFVVLKIPCEFLFYPINGRNGIEWFSIS